MNPAQTSRGSDWDNRARAIAADATRIPMVFRLLVMHILMDSIRSDHEMFVRTMVDMSGIPMPTGAPVNAPAQNDDQNPLFETTRAAAHALSPGGAPLSI